MDVSGGPWWNGHASPSSQIWGDAIQSEAMQPEGITTGKVAKATPKVPTNTAGSPLHTTPSLTLLRERAWGCLGGEATRTGSLYPSLDMIATSRDSSNAKQVVINWS